MLKRLASIGAAVAITLGGALLATPAQAGVPHPVPVPTPVQNSVTRTVNLRAGEACEFPVRIRVRIADLERSRLRNGRIVVTADGIRGRVTNLRTGDTFRYRGDERLRINLRSDVIRGDGSQLLLLNRSGSRFINVRHNIVPRRQVNRLVFTEDPTRAQLLGGRIPVLPRERLIRSGDLVNVCDEIRPVRRVLR